MRIEATAQVLYTCILTKEDEDKVLSYAKENNVSLDEAVNDLWENGDIDIYAGNCTESDCNTEEVHYLD